MKSNEFKRRLTGVAERQYHDKHPFHLRMLAGRLTRAQLQAWTFNRFYYQSKIPIKDAILLSRSSDLEFRRHWRQRIVNHDGTRGQKGGIEKWIRLAEATGIPRKALNRTEEVLPGVRYAVDAYLHFVERRSFLEAVASSLTELFAPALITLRLSKLKAIYPWLGGLEGSLDYFEDRIPQATEESKIALDYVCSNAKTRAEQELAISALRSKCEILWAQLDAIYYAYVSPGWIPPGAFRPKAKVP